MFQMNWNNLENGKDKEMEAAVEAKRRLCPHLSPEFEEGRGEKKKERLLERAIAHFSWGCKKMKKMFRK